MKYTTARDVARRTVDFVAGRIGKKVPPCRTATTPLYGGEIDRFDEFLKENVNRKLHGLGEQVIAHLSRNYGSALGDILLYEREVGRAAREETRDPPRCLGRKFCTQCAGRWR